MASGGVAGDLGFTMQTNSYSALGFSLSGATIPISNGAVLVQISFTGYEGGDILFGTENSCSAAAPNVISNAGGGCVDADWISYVLGCSDEEACNNDIDATADDGSCEYAEDDYDCDGNCLPESIQEDGSCGLAGLSGCMDESACNYWSAAELDEIGRAHV